MMAWVWLCKGGGVPPPPQQVLNHFCTSLDNLGCFKKRPGRTVYNNKLIKINNQKNNFFLDATCVF